MLRENAPEEFDVLHFAAMAELRKKTDKKQSYPKFSSGRILRCIPTRIRNAQSSLYTKISCPGTAPGQEILLFTSNYRSSANHSNSNAPV